MALEREMETYRRELPRLLDRQGKFMVVHGEAVAGVYETFDEALRAAYTLFKLEPFLIKEIQAEEKPVHFTRDLKQCPS
jgi:hypothetical protein